MDDSDIEIAAEVFRKTLMPTVAKGQPWAKMEATSKRAYIEAMEKAMLSVNALNGSRGKDYWATHNSCNGVFDVFAFREAALAAQKADPVFENVVRVRVFEDDLP